MPFLLKLNFNSLGNISIGKGEGWLMHTNDSNLSNGFFDWLEGKRFHPESTAEYIDENTTTSDLFTIRKYIKILRFHFSENESAKFYYQQRYHSTENDNIETLNSFLGNITEPYLRQLIRRFALDKLLGEKINMLSTGEFRKAFVLKAAIAKPGVIFMEEPYTGIDSESCKLLNQLFEHLVLGGSSIVIFTSINQKPDFISHNFSINNENSSIINDIEHIVIPDITYNDNFNSAFELKNVFARYNGRDVLHNINWKVNRNQKWSLTGHNGAGKSTLLSFVYADNPQVYCNKVFLFDKKRGSGESIWEVKDQIGFYSSELHLYFNKMQTVEVAINSIVFQNPYQRRTLTSSENNFKIQLLNYFNLDLLEQKLLIELSSVTQKIVILVAVLLKNAPLLILVEPFQGFNDQLIQKSLTLIDKYVENRTFIMVSHNNSDFPECINRHFYLEKGIGHEVAEI